MPRLNPAVGSAVSVLMRGCSVFLVLVTLELSAFCGQSGSPATAANNAGAALPKPALNPPVGTWRYKESDSLARLNNHSTFSITIKDDGSVWTVTSAWQFPEGPVTDVSTLEKGTLILRKELFE